MIQFSEKLRSLTPEGQFKAMKNNEEMQESIKDMNALVGNIPNLYETDGMSRHPLFLHYFAEAYDCYICEYDGDDTFFGYTILNNDFENSEFGYISKKDIFCLEKITPLFNLDFYCRFKSIEEALYNKNPNYFSKYKPEAQSETP